MNKKTEESFKKKKITKESLREEIKAKRDELSDEDVKEKSKTIKERLFSLPEFKSAHTVAFYVNLKKTKEVETEEMIKESLEIGKRVLVPITDMVGKKLVFSEIKKLEDLSLGEFDILEPVPELRKILPYEAIRLVVVPGVVFDLHCHRIGYGLGFYDKFLSKLTRYVTKIGLAYELQIVDNLPKEDHDIKLGKVITEERIIERE